MSDEIIYAVEVGDVLLRVLKISPCIKNKKFSYGGAKIEILRIKRHAEEEDYELIAECILGVEASMMIGSILQNIALECLNEMRNIMAYFSMASSAIEKCNNSNKAYR